LNSIFQPNTDRIRGTKTEEKVSAWSSAPVEHAANEMRIVAEPFEKVEVERQIDTPGNILGFSPSHLFLQHGGGR
jgi:hypothetical protein